MYANIKSANHGMKITLNEYQMTLIAIFRKLQDHFQNQINSNIHQPKTEHGQIGSYIMSNKQLNNKARHC